MQKSAIANRLKAARGAYARSQWDDAFTLFAEADRGEPLAVADLERFRWAAALTGRDDDFLAVNERLYRQFLALEEAGPAARAAFWLCLRLYALGETGQASGWLGRAHRLVGDTDCVEQGYLLLPVVHRHLAAGDNEAARDIAQRAADIGSRFAELDLIALARNFEGRAVLRQGRIPEGVALLDEAMLAVKSDHLLPLITGLIYCSVIDSCQEVFALDRCREWTHALSDWCDAQPQLVTFTGACLVHRAQVMEMNGEWTEAMREASQASARFSSSRDPEASAAAFYQQGEIHRLRGAFSAAEQAYRKSSDLGGEPQPGLALLRLAQGQHEAAATGIRGALAATRKPFARARLLPGCVEIMLAAGWPDDARAACQEIEAFAAEHESTVISAIAAHARGAVLLADGDAAAALAMLREAFAAWQQFGAPYLAARVRVAAGRACMMLGDRDGAELAFAYARSVFESLGAAPDLAALENGRGNAAADGGHGLTRRELEVLRLVARGRTNKAIAAELSISARTVDRHLGNIFNKIDVSSRASATAFAYDSGIV